MSKQITVYTLAELKTLNPAAYAAVHERWKDLDHDAWTEETMKSLRAVVDACGARLNDWQIGPFSPSFLCVGFTDEGETLRDLPWFQENVLTPNSYTSPGYFPGLCPFTGYCADEDFLEAVYAALVAGRSMKQALEGLAAVAQQLMENDLEQQQEEETMMANWDCRFYAAEGEEV